MRPDTQAALNRINRDFYRLHADSFSSTRESPWRGWTRVLEPTRAPGSILDLGCGNGRFASFADEVCSEAQPTFVGTDLSPALLHTARERSPQSHFVCHDLLETPPAALFGRRFELITAFGVLHHIPGFRQRSQLLQSAASLLEPNGSVVFTFWQFGGDPRFERRTLPWSDSPVPVDASDVEEGDHLLKWGDSRDATAVRYCHYTTPGEANELAEDAGLRIADSFVDDGRNRMLNLYARFVRD